MRVRSASLADVPAIARIHVDSWRAAYRGLMPQEVLDALDIGEREKKWHQRLHDRVHPILVAEHEGRVAGWVAPMAARDPEFHGLGEVMALYVDPACFRMGIGRELWAAALEELRSHGFDEAVVWVLTGNARARAFYEAMGGQLVEGAHKDWRSGGHVLPEVAYRVAWSPAST